jgi:hypothetical protein
MQKVLAIISTAVLLLALGAGASASPARDDDTKQTHDRTSVRTNAQSGHQDDNRPTAPTTTVKTVVAKDDGSNNNVERGNNDTDDSKTPPVTPPTPVPGTVDVLMGVAPVASQPNACNWAGHLPGVAASNDGSDASYCVWGVMPVGTWIRYPLAAGTSVANFRVYMPCVNVPEDANRPAHPPSLYEVWLGNGTDLTGATKIGGGSSVCGTDAGLVNATVTATGSSLFYVATADCDIAPACDATLATMSAHAFVPATLAPVTTAAPTTPARSRTKHQ